MGCAGARLAAAFVGRGAGCAAAGGARSAAFENLQCRRIGFVVYGARADRGTDACKFAVARGDAVVFAAANHGGKLFVRASACRKSGRLARFWCTDDVIHVVSGADFLCAARDAGGGAYIGGIAGRIDVSHRVLGVARTGGALVRFTFALVVAVSPLLVSETVILKGDALGVLFFALSVCFVIRFMEDARAENDASSTYVFLLLGLAVASRFTYLVLFPILLILILLKVWTFGKTGRWKRLVRGLASAMVAFVIPILIFVPFVWTSPLTTAKSFAGNALFLTTLSGADAARLALLGSIVDMVGLPALVLTVIGFFWVWKASKRLTALTLLAVFGAVFLPLARSGFVEGRYTLPLLAPLALWAGYGAAAVRQLIAGRATHWAGAVVGVILAVVVLMNGAQVGTGFLGQHAESGASHMAEWLVKNTSGADTIALPMNMQVYLPPNGNALKRILGNYANDPDSAERRFLHLLSDVHLSGGDAKTLPGFMLEAWFGEDERMDRFRYATMQFAAGAGASPVNAKDVYYYEFGTAEKPDLISAADVEGQFEKGGIDYLVTDATRLAPGGAARQLVCFGSLCVYGKP